MQHSQAHSKNPKQTYSRKKSKKIRTSEKKHMEKKIRITGLVSLYLFTFSECVAFTNQPNKKTKNITCKEHAHTRKLKYTGTLTNIETATLMLSYILYYCSCIFHPFYLLLFFVSFLFCPHREQPFPTKLKK